VTARGYDAALTWSRRNADEHRLEPERAKPQADFVILGQAVSGERAAVFQRGELRERSSCDRASDAGKGDCRADRLAYHQLLDVSLGELIAIMTTDPA